MVCLHDAVALSLWYNVPRTAIVDVLRRVEGALPLEGLIEEVTHARAAPGLADRLLEEAASAIARARTAGIEAIGLGDPRYPSLLAVIDDAPPVLWLTGAITCLSLPTVALVGSRAASPYGLEAASRLAGDLASAGVVVVSGLARGIDSAAHRAVLAAGGETAAVLGSGVDVIYPREHDVLAAEIARHGVVLSELPPGTAPEAFHFPERNRIISGLSLAVVVVEAAQRSGSLITARFGLEQGRAVMAVPGSVLSGRHRGSHGLIRDGAVVVESADDILAELRAGYPKADAAAPEPLADPILERMEEGEGYDLDALESETGLRPAQLLPRLLQLELRGAVRRLDGGQFVRAGRTC
jgi:DNA processing protein